MYIACCGHRALASTLDSCSVRRDCSSTRDLQALTRAWKGEETKFGPRMSRPLRRAAQTFDKVASSLAAVRNAVVGMANNAVPRHAAGADEIKSLLSEWVSRNVEVPSASIADSANGGCAVAVAVGPTPTSARELFLLHLTLDGGSSSSASELTPQVRVGMASRARESSAFVS